MNCKKPREEKRNSYIRFVRLLKTFLQNESSAGAAATAVLVSQRRQRIRSDASPTLTPSRG